jgi:hypothetical protein
MLKQTVENMQLNASKLQNNFAIVKEVLFPGVERAQKADRDFRMIGLREGDNVQLKKNDKALFVSEVKAALNEDYYWHEIPFLGRARHANRENEDYY